MLPHYPAMLAWAYEQRFATARQLGLHIPEYVRRERTTRYQYQQLTAVLDTEPSHDAHFDFNSDGSFIYTAEASWAGIDSFTYYADDGVNQSLATVYIDVLNSAPITEDDTYDWLQEHSDKVHAPGVLGNDGDNEGDPLTATLVTQAENGTVKLEQDGSFRCTPDEGFTGTDSVTYEASDGEASSTALCRSF